MDERNRGNTYIEVEVAGSNLSCTVAGIAFIVLAIPGERGIVSRSFHGNRIKDGRNEKHIYLL